MGRKQGVSFQEAWKERNRMGEGGKKGREV